MSERRSGGLALATRAPFHLEATVRVLQRRPTSRVDLWEGDRYHRVLRVGETPVLVELRNKGSIENPDVRFSVLSGELPSASMAMLKQTLRKVLGLDVNPEPFQRLAGKVPALRPTVLALRGLRPPRFPDLFEAFARVIPFQQLSLEAGVAIVGRLVERLGEPLEHRGRRFRAFPTASQIAHARMPLLRACGLSASKAETLRRAARACESGELDGERIAGMSTPAALEALMQLPGIGPWSAALVLLRGLGRLNVFPPGDVGAMRALSTLLQVAPGAPLARAIERFGDLRGYLYFYGLAESLLRTGFIQPASFDDARGSTATHA
jgi:DNA-3-methyladenine glycosylase II